MRYNRLNTQKFLVFQRKNYLFFTAFVLVIYAFIAGRFPITNDEAYYFSYARNLQLSYVDSPPFVAYLSFLQIHLGYHHPFILRFFVMLLHFVSTLCLMSIVKNNCAQDKQLHEKLFITFLLAYVIPIFGLQSFLVLPDCGLLLSLSMMLLVIDAVYRTQRLSEKNMIVLGLALGIGFLSKYHIIVLGGGMILGILAYLVNIKKKSGLFPKVVLFKLSISILFGLILAAPLWIWNYHNHYASFIFQLQHGFKATGWHFKYAFLFLLGVSIYLLPGFAYFLIKQGLFSQKKYYLIIPFIALELIMLISSVRTKALPHWGTPIFWLMIPYAVINTEKLHRIKKMLLYCLGILWIPIFLLCLSPNGMSNLKVISKIITPNTSYLADFLLWNDIQYVLSHNKQMQKIIQEHAQKQYPECQSTQPLIGVTRWYWAAQLENIFPQQYKILNLDQNSSNFYLWRDKMEHYAHCPILMFLKVNHSQKLDDKDLRILMTVHDYEVIKDEKLRDYQSFDIILAQATLHSKDVLYAMQNDLLQHTRY